MKKRHMILLVIVLFSALFFSRLKWENLTSTSNEANISQGRLDLQDWYIGENKEQYFILNGEWEFYPEQFLYGPDATAEQAMSYINLPQAWNDKLGEKETPYGYGTYRLSIQMHPNTTENLALYIPSVRSASAVYVNGRFIEQSGEVATEASNYLAKNLPYTATFTPDESGKAEVVIQVANFKDPRNSGVIRSITFGVESVVENQRNFSFILQSITIVIFSILSLYLFIFYFIGKRDKRIVIFALFLIGVNVLINLTSNEKVLQHILPVSYDGSFRMTYAMLAIVLGLLLQTFSHKHLPIWRNIYPYFLAGLGTIFVFALIAPISTIVQMVPIYFGFAFIATVIALIVLIQRSTADIQKNFPLLLGFFVLIHDSAWTTYWRALGVNTIYYPIDMILTVGIYSSIWFLDYVKVNKETKRLVADLQLVNKQKNEFLAHTAHEFNNPLNAVLNMSQAVLDREKPIMQNKSVMELELIHKVGRRMAIFLNDLIDQAQLEDGKPTLYRTPVSLPSTLDEVVKLLHFNLDTKDIDLIIEIPATFPNLYVDENRLIQILFNLLHNSIKYTNYGAITIHATVQDDQAMISITDTGVGMDENTMQKIFTTYERYSEHMHGFGIGLSVTKQLVELHGGTIEVISALDKGSTFVIYLPMESSTTDYLVSKPVQSLEVTNTVSKHNNVRISRQTNQRPRILLVDDDPINLHVLETILDADKYDIVTALNGRVALEWIEKEKWNLIISDVMMPNMSGYELTKIIRKSFPKTELPILLVTAKNQPEDLKAGFLAGANDYVAKPIESIELLARVDALIDMKESVFKQLQLESAWLQAQIYPHFIFNTLNAISALYELDPPRMKELLHEFSTFLRSKYQYHHIDELIPLQDELKIATSYLNIEQLRFGSRLNVQWKVNVEREEEVKVPFLSIQPFVENAVHHGVMKKMTGGTVTIQMKEEETTIKVSIIDDGAGMDEETLHTIMNENNNLRAGVGLKNTHQRIKRIFGTGITIRSAVNQGTTISFYIPKGKKDSTEETR